MVWLLLVHQCIEVGYTVGDGSGPAGSVNRLSARVVFKSDCPLVGSDIAHLVSYFGGCFAVLSFPGSCVVLMWFVCVT